MKLQHLRFFCAVVESRSMTLAAERLHISQPAISAGLKALQDEMGEALFDRSGGKHRIEPTSRALRFYGEAKDILDRCEKARGIFRESQARPISMRVGVLRTLSSDHVAAVLADAASRSEPVWKAREGSVAELGGWLAQGRLDIVWSVIDETTPHSEILWEEPFAVLVARRHPLAKLHPKGVTLADAASLPLILRTGCELRAGKLQGSGLKFHIAARVSRDDLALKLIASGMGAAIGPASFQNEAVVALPLAEPGFSRRIGLRWRRETPEPLVRAVRDTVLAVGRPETGREAMSRQL